MSDKLSEKWIKASIAGTIWAASEIVLGSFLHNLKVPFSGNILTAIGIIILISISHIWREKGLFWRSGLICAIMKTMSPSAVIFGPMIAIFAESVLLELSTRILGRTIAGYILGAMLAMSWNLFHKIASFIIFYGANIIDVYTNLLRMAQRQLGIESDIVWLPIIILLVIYALFGLFAGIIGVRVGQKLQHQPAASTVDIKPGKAAEIKRPAKEFNYSVPWLLLNFLLIILSFTLLIKTLWYVWVPAITSIAVLWALRYRRAMRQLSKPKFWVVFVIITILTAFVFTASGEGDFWRTGLLTGISMNFRAVVIIMGFSALGTELYNPAVRNYFSRTAFRNLPLAVELSVESLPYFITAIPDFKSFLRNPVSVFHSVLSHAGSRFSEIKDRKRTIFIVTGDRAEGKTTFTKMLSECLEGAGVRVRGFICERIMNGPSTTGYDLVDLSGKQKYPFLRENIGNAAPSIGKFTILSEGLMAGKQILKPGPPGEKIIYIIDEAGALELSNGGWSDSINELLAARNSKFLVLVVRREFVDDIIRKWAIDKPVIIDIKDYDTSGACSLIVSQAEQE